MGGDAAVSSNDEFGRTLVGSSVAVPESSFNLTDASNRSGVSMTRPNYGPYCELFFFLMKHETDLTEPVQEPLPVRHMSEPFFFHRPAGSFAFRSK